MTVTGPIIFDEYLETGLEDGLSPFISPYSRHWGKHLTLKLSLLAAFLLLLAFITSYFPFLDKVSHVCLLFTFFIVGTPAFIDTVENIIDLKINIEVLMTLAAFSSAFIGNPIEGALLLVLFAVSGAMERSVSHKAKSSLSRLNKLAPKMAYVFEEGHLFQKPIQSIPVGETIFVHEGEIIPLDGIVIEGASSVNLIHLTGESVPVPKKVGENVPAGGYNLEGALTLKVTKTSNESTLAKIITMVTQAQESKPQIQRFFNRISQRYASSIIALSFIFALLFPFLFHMPFIGPEGSIYRALAFLIAASPCALILAIPISYLSAVGSCARSGILLKGGVVLDALATCRAIAFDKTGTLTTGNLTFLGIHSVNASKELLEQAEAIAFSLEKNSVHPIAQSLSNFAKENNIKEIAIENFKAMPGKGLSGTLASNRKEVFIGHPRAVEKTLKENIKEKFIQETTRFQKQGETVSPLVVGEEIVLFRFSDTVRPKMPAIIQELRKKLGFKCFMLTGDHNENAQAVAKTLGGLDYVASELQPEDKLNFVTKHADQEGLAMIGDGVNDAPALARATVGISMGKVGSTATIDVSDIVLLHDNLEMMPFLVKKALMTRKIVIQNLIFASFALIAASILALGGQIPLWMAVIFHEGGTVLVGLNGLRLLRT